MSLDTVTIRGPLPELTVEEQARYDRLYQETLIERNSFTVRQYTSQMPEQRDSFQTTDLVPFFGYANFRRRTNPIRELDQEGFEKGTLPWINGILFGYNLAIVLDTIWLISELYM